MRFGENSELEIVESPCPGDCGRQVKHMRVGRPRLCDHCREAQEQAAEEREQAAEEEHQARLRLWREQNVESLLVRAGCPAKYSSYTRAAWESRWKPWAEMSIESIHGQTWTLAQIAERWLAQEDPHRDWLLVLIGKHGRRKTGLATAILGEALKLDHQCLWVDAESWADDLEYGLERPAQDSQWVGSQQQVFRQWRSFQQVFRQAAEAPRLLVDDLAAIRAGRQGNRQSQDWWRERLALLLRQRDAHLRPTIATGNIADLSELQAINHSLPSRMNVPLAFKIGGPDMRWDRG